MIILQNNIFCTILVGVHVIGSFNVIFNLSFKLTFLNAKLGNYNLCKQLSKLGWVQVVSHFSYILVIKHEMMVVEVGQTIQMKRIHNAPWGVFFIKVPLWVYYSY
jgi:hypothetical protein